MTSSWRWAQCPMADVKKQQQQTEIMRAWLGSCTLCMLPAKQDSEAEILHTRWAITTNSFVCDRFFPKKEKKRKKKKLAWGWRKVSSQSLDVFLLGILFKSIRFSGFWGSCAVLEKTLPEWIIYKAAGNCKLWWTNLFDVLISWGAVSVPPSATFCRDSGLSLAMAAQSPQKVAQLPNKGQDGKEVSSQDAPLSPLVPPAARLLKRV